LLVTHRSEAVGLVLARPARMLGHEPFFGELIAGIEEVLATENRSLLLHVVPDHSAEISAYRRWAAGCMVEGVVVVNVIRDDPRVPVLVELGVPAVVVGGPRTGMDVTNIWIDDARAMRDAVAYLIGLGHDRLARVSGPHHLGHTYARSEAFLDECERSSAHAVIVEGDYSEEAGKRAARSLLGRQGTPSAIVFDNDVMALAALTVAGEMRIDVPGQLSLLAWDDSALCRLSNPPLSAMTLDVHAMGQQVGTCVLNTLADGPVRSHMAPLPRLTARASTGRLAHVAAAPSVAVEHTRGGTTD